MQDIWKYFLDLNRKRGGGFGPSPLSYSEILSYFTLHRIEYDAIELYLLDVLDNIAMEYFAEKAEKEQAKVIRRNKKK
jgi:hypothetical protein